MRRGGRAAGLYGLAEPSTFILYRANPTQVEILEAFLLCSDHSSLFRSVSGLSRGILQQILHFLAKPMTARHATTTSDAVPCISELVRSVGPPEPTASNRSH